MKVLWDKTPARVLGLDEIARWQPCGEEYAAVSFAYPHGVPLRKHVVEKLQRQHVDVVWGAIRLLAERGPDDLHAFLGLLLPVMRQNLLWELQRSDVTLLAQRTHWTVALMESTASLIMGKLPGDVNDLVTEGWGDVAVYVERFGRYLERWMVKTETVHTVTKAAFLARSGDPTVERRLLIPWLLQRLDIH